jgi:hypothetical protein
MSFSGSTGIVVPFATIVIVIDSLGAGELPDAGA